MDEALKLDPKNVMAYGSRGAVYQELGWNDRAIQDLNETIRINPEDTVAYNKRGIAYYELGQLERATQDYATEMGGGTRLARNKAKHQCRPEP